jgi:hypothetical protein
VNFFTQESLYIRKILRPRIPKNPKLQNWWGMTSEETAGEPTIKKYIYISYSVFEWKRTDFWLKNHLTLLYHVYGTKTVKRCYKLHNWEKWSRHKMLEKIMKCLEGSSDYISVSHSHIQYRVRVYGLGTGQVCVDVTADLVQLWFAY